MFLSNYTTEEGEKLGAWILNQRTAYAKEMLSQDQIGRLEKIGIYWENRNDRQWNEVYRCRQALF